MKLFHGTLVLALSSLSLVLVACGGHVSSDGSQQNPGNGNNPDTGTGGVTPGDDTGTTPPPDDAGTPDTTPPVDHGAPSDTYPAFKPDMPQLQNNGGDVLSTPVVVTVTFPSEVASQVPIFEDLGDKIGPSDYWKKITSEYGVGAASGGGHVHSTADLTSDDASDTGIDNYVADHATNYAKYGWPAPTDHTIYVLYVPRATAFTFSGSDD